jgi:RNA polymerase sigma-70 factor, ECF subfamily
MRSDRKHLVLIESSPPSEHGASELESRDDDELMQLAAAGMTRAFELLTRRHQTALRSYCTRRCGVALGDDVAQEVLLAVWAGRSSYAPRGCFRAYLFTIAERRCHNALRAAGRAARRSMGTADAAPEATAFEVLLRRERQRRLFEVVNELSAEQRRTLFLRFAADLGYEEIAALTGRGTATVRTRVRMGLTQLRRRLARRAEP